jgi:hypothetical protein
MFSSECALARIGWQALGLICHCLVFCIVKVCCAAATELLAKSRPPIAAYPSHRARAHPKENLSSKLSTRLSLAEDARGFGALAPAAIISQPSVIRACDVMIFVLTGWAGVAAVFVTTGMLGLLALSGDLHAMD